VSIDLVFFSRIGSGIGKESGGAFLTYNGLIGVPS